MWFPKESGSQSGQSEKRVLCWESPAPVPEDRPVNGVSTAQEPSLEMPTGCWVLGIKWELNRWPYSSMTVRIYCSCRGCSVTLLPSSSLLPMAGKEQDLLYLPKEKIPLWCWKYAFIRTAIYLSNLHLGHGSFLAYYSYTFIQVLTTSTCVPKRTSTSANRACSFDLYLCPSTNKCHFLLSSCQWGRKRLPWPGLWIRKMRWPHPPYSWTLSKM